MQVFPYHIRQRLLLLLGAAVVLTVLAKISGGRDVAFADLFFVLLVGLGLYVVFPIPLRHRQLVVGPEGLTIRLRWRSDQFLPYDAIRRIVVREVPATLPYRQSSFTAFLADSNIRLPLNGLHASSHFLQLVEAKAREYGFPLIYQNARGEILEEAGKD